MVNIMKMRLPLSEEYNHLARLVGESDAWMNWSGVFSWCQDKNPGRSAFRATRGCTALREARGCVTCRERTLMPGDVRSESVGFRPSFKAETDIPDGQVCVVGTLFMNGEPVRIPVCSKFAASYVPGTTLELRPALEDENFQVRAIRAGGVLIADRVLLRNISWDDIQEALAGDKPAAHPLRLGKMRFPTCAEYDSLADTAKEANGIMHWKGIYSWCQDVRPGWPSSRVVRGSRLARYRSSCIAANRYVDVGFRPAFDTPGADALGPDGTIVTVGTLYMDGQPVKVPQNPVWNGDILDYIPGARLEMREALADPAYQVKAILVGGVLIADRVLLKNISWNDIQGALATPARRVKIKSMRLPSSEEWDRMIDATLGVNSIVHWKGTFSWCLNECADNHDRRVTRGRYAGRHADAYKSESRMVSVGFRPVFDIENPKSIPEGEMVTVGTLYMDGRPVPTNHNGDMKLPAYIPGARLELRESAEDPKYHVKAIRAGDVLIGDRVLLSQISWDDLAKLGFCGNKNLKGETIMKDTTIIYLGNADDAYTIACSKQNEKKVLNFLTKRYPEWAKEYEGRELSLWNKLLDTVEVMKDLLEDDNLELLSKGNVAAIRLRDEVYGDSVVLCSRENEERVKAFLLKRYPKWSGNCIGKTGLTPWNDVEDAVRDMKELLGDGNLEFQPSCRDIPIPTDPIKN